jgi:hypothetical protein
MMARFLESPMYTFHADRSEFRIVRRAKRWFIESGGDTIGTFASAAAAAQALAECELLWPDAVNVPADLSAWQRGPADEKANLLA